MTSLDLDSYRVLAGEARDKAYTLAVGEEGWTVTSAGMGEGVSLEWREGDEGGVVREDGGEGGVAGWKCWRLRATMEAEMETVIGVLMDYDNSCKWNPALSKTKIVEKPDAEFMVTYQITSGQRPIVTPRDFTFLVSVARDEREWVGGGCSVHLPTHPVTSSHVRAWQYPTCMIVKPFKDDNTKSEFTWLLQCDFGGMMPIGLLNMAMPYAIKLFTSSLRKQVVKVQKEKEK